MLVCEMRQDGGSFFPIKVSHDMMRAVQKLGTIGPLAPQFAGGANWVWFFMPKEIRR